MLLWFVVFVLCGYVVLFLFGDELGAAIHRFDLWWTNKKCDWWG